MIESESPRAVAERLLEQEQRETKDQRLAELEAQETTRRELEERERREEEAREAARELAEALAYERGALEDQAEKEMAVLLRTLGELSELDKRHRATLQAAGLPLPAILLTRMLQGWTATRLGDFSSGASFDWSRGRSLREQDPLAPEG